MSHKLGVYYAPEHTRQEDIRYIEALQPPVIRILDPDVQQIADMHRLAPDAIIAPRTWAIDDGSTEQDPSKQVRRIMADPVATGKDHAHQYRAQWDRWQAEAAQRGLTLPPVDRVMFNAANEPNQGGTPEQIALYNYAFLDWCTELGIRAAALCLGVGWPDNTGTDTPPDWRPYEILVNAIRAGNHWLELHEYFYKSGPQDGWLWWAGRHLQCPFDVPILLGEIGIDNYVDEERWQNEGGNRGWVGNVGPEQYADMLLWQVRHSDTRVVAALPFITDYRNNSWESFNTRSAHGALLSRRHQMIPQTQFVSAADAPPQHNAYVPHVQTPGPEPTSAPEQPQPVELRGSAIDPLVLEAIVNIESGGDAYDKDGGVLIRFEAHQFIQRAANQIDATQHFRVLGPKPWQGQEYRYNVDAPWRPVHEGDSTWQYEPLKVAERIDYRAAYESISMGLGQIMGFNAERVGYPSAKAMFDAFSRSEAAQLAGMFNYILSDYVLYEATRRKDWRTIAQLYNGAGNVDVYAPMLEAEYRRLRDA